ncbi:hypothetical protein GCM10010151_67130 [Actinoallomurus spadix]|uniref:Uncharacterized protein n=1 Tax=Actinoallomurus spadix TaxID=79912 RepID=A0ABN0XM93_9ACTN
MASSSACPGSSWVLGNGVLAKCFPIPGNDDFIRLNMKRAQQSLPYFIAREMGRRFYGGDPEPVNPLFSFTGST